jgi:amino acid transporter
MENKELKMTLRSWVDIILILVMMGSSSVGIVYILTTFMEENIYSLGWVLCSFLFLDILSRRIKTKEN